MQATTEDFTLTWNDEKRESLVMLLWAFMADTKNQILLAPNEVITYCNFSNFENRLPFSLSTYLAPIMRINGIKYANNTFSINDEEVLKLALAEDKLSARTNVGYIIDAINQQQPEIVREAALLSELSSCLYLSAKYGYEPLKLVCKDIFKQTKGESFDDDYDLLLDIAVHRNLLIQAKLSGDNKDITYHENYLNYVASSRRIIVDDAGYTMMYWADGKDQFITFTKDFLAKVNL